MSKRSYVGTELDRIYGSAEGRSPDFRVYLWNPNRCDVQDVVLGRARSPRYDITPWVERVQYEENVVFENNDEAVAGHVVLTVVRQEDATPIPVDETTLLDGAPIRIYQGDQRVPACDWVLIFTGTIVGNPSVDEHARDPDPAQRMQVMAVDRAQKYLNSIVTARAYEKDTDVGQAAVETAIERMSLERREIDVGDQGYAIGHTQAQLVDIAVLPGIAQMLFCTGKKPKFNAEGKLTAADTDFSKAAARTHRTRGLAIAIRRLQRGASGNNSVRLLGLDDELTEVVEREKRLAHGTVTTGYFENEVHHKVWFSTAAGSAEGGRKAKDTRIRSHAWSLRAVGGDVRWEPYLESDGYTCFGGVVKIDTGFAPEIMALMTLVFGALQATEIVLETWIAADVAAASAQTPPASLADAARNMEALKWVRAAKWASLMAIMVIMQTIGRVEYEIYGKPFTNVFQQLSATAQLAGVLTEDIREVELRNDWLYDLDVMKARAKELLRRELAKGWTYELDLLDDPILEVDDVLQIVSEKFYVLSISKVLERGAVAMRASAWRIA